MQDHSCWHGLRYFSCIGWRRLLAHLSHQYSRDPIKLEPIPAGWTSYIASPLYLNSAAPVDGPPQRRGELVPTAERKAKGQTIFAYQLEGTFPEGKWLQCSYGEYGQVALSKRIDDSIRRCEVSYRQGSKAGQHEIGIDCR